MSKRILVLGSQSSLGSYVLQRLQDHDLTLPTKNWLNFTDEDSVNDFIEFFVWPKEYDAIIVLSGMAPGRAGKDYSAEQIDEVMRVNFTGPARIIAHARLSQNAKVIWVSSISALKGSYDPYYAAAKAAVNGFMKSRALWDGKTATYITLCPSLIRDTKMCQDMLPERVEFHAANSPTGELNDPNDIAATIHDILEGDWRSANGAVLNLSGGAYAS